MFGTIGFVLSLALLIYLSFKGYSPIITSIAASVTVGLFNGFNFYGIFSDYYLPSMVGFIKSWFLIFTLGAVFSELLGVTGSVEAIANGLLNTFKSKNAVLIIALITALLTLGGVNFYVQIFIIWPICIVFSRVSDIPRGIWIGVYYMGMFCVSSFPGSPGMSNVILSEGLGVSSASGAALGIFLTLINFTLGIAYFNALLKKWQKQGMHYIANEKDTAVEAPQNRDCPGFITALAPMAVVIIMYITLTSNFVKRFGIELTSSNAVFTVMLVGCVLCVLLNLKRIKGKLKKAIISSSTGGINPTVTAAVLTGYLGVFTASPTYASLIDTIQALNVGTFFQAFIACNVLTFITGSGTVAVTPVLNAFKDSWLGAGANAQLLRPVMAASVAGTSISPHCGGLSGVMSYAGSNISECYKPIFFGVVCVSLITSFIGAVLATLLF